MPGLDYELLSIGRASAIAGEKETARRYLERFLRRSPPEDERLEALYWLSEVSDDPQEKRALLEEILACNLGDVRARRKLALLDGKLQLEEIVDADHLPIPKETPQNGVRTFTCPQCGGKLTYTPDGQSLICEYCESQTRLQKERPQEEDDFLLALATAKAQRHPIHQQVIICQGCGASFTLPPKVITHICPFCQTPYALEQIEIHELDAPDSILPFKISREEAIKMTLQWLQENPPEEKPSLKSLYGVYLPAWVFTVGGQIDWNGWIYKNKKTVPVKGRRIINFPDFIVPAVKNFPPSLESVFQSFPLSELVAFETGYLANFYAETFQISAADASLKAREQAVRKIKQEIPSSELSDIYDMAVKTSNIVVETYRLVLLPAWMITLGIGMQEIHLAINGYNGQCFTDHVKSQSNWLKDFLGF